MAYLTYIGLGIFGLIIGSFLNVVIHRGPQIWGLVDDHSRTGNLAFPGSYCPACKTPLRAQQLIPLVSYASLGGKCASCEAKISLRYPIVEMLGAFSCVIAVIAFGISWAGGAAMVYFWFLVALAAIDHETRYLPDALTLTLIGLGIIANGFGLFTSLTHATIGAIAGYCFFWLVAFTFRKLRGIDGLGLGDAKLLAAIGAWTGWQLLSPTILAASLLALGTTLIANIAGNNIDRNTHIPFGPALAFAGVAALLSLSGFLRPAF